VPIGVLNKKVVFYEVITTILHSEKQLLHKESYTVIQDAITYIHSSFMETITLTGLAERYNLTPKYFSHLFHKYQGIAPIDYLIQHRMNKAQEWLQTKQFTVATVARSVGYSDPYYFSKLFKKYKGVAPSFVGLMPFSSDVLASSKIKLLQ